MSQHHDEHHSPIKTPKQLILAVIFAFLVPIFVIALLVRDVGSDRRDGAGSEAMSEQAVAERIRPVAKVAIKLEGGPLKTGEQVFVELEIAPWVLRLRRDAAGALHVETHTGRPLEADAVRTALVDEQGRLFLDTAIGLGLVASADMDLAADEVLAGRWQPEEVDSATLPARCGHVLSPARA